MKTLSYYKQLRESYACVIPKTAPAYELIEALDVLIASLQPDETDVPVDLPTFPDVPVNQPHFLGVPVNLPKGWRIIHHTRGNVCVTLHDNTRQIGHIWTADNRYMISYRASKIGEHESLQSAIAHLVKEATTQGYSIFNYYGQELRIPEGWHMARDDDDDYILLDAAGVAFGKVSMTREGNAWAYVDTAPGGAQYSSTLLGALNGLIARAWSCHDAP